MRKFAEEFKTFVMRGNVIDMAVGVIIGGAFSGIVNSLVNDIVMPVITLITGKINFTDKLLALDGGQYASLAGCKGCRRAGHRIRKFHPARCPVPFDRVRDLSGHQRNQQTAPSGPGCRGYDKGMPIL